MAVRTVTIQDVARRAGVSAQTVSNVLNRPERVRPVTARKVRAAVDELEYRAHAAARRLRTHRSETIGLRLASVPGGLSGVILDVFLHEITSLAADHGLGIRLYTASSLDDEVDRLRELVAAGDIDGVILTDTQPNDPRPTWLTDHEVPCVSFGRPWEPENQSCNPWVDVDGAAGTAQATTHLLREGARTIAFLGWLDPVGQGAARYEGWRSVLMEHGIAESALEQLVVTAPDTVESAVRATSALLARDRRIDGIVCASDSLAFGAYLAVEGGVPVVGFDNTPVARAVGLSSIDQRIDRVARAVFDLLLVDGEVAMREEREMNYRLITPELRIRHTVVQDPDSEPEPA